MPNQYVVKKKLKEDFSFAWILLLILSLRIVKFLLYRVYRDSPY